MCNLYHKKNLKSFLEIVVGKSSDYFSVGIMGN